MYRRYAWELLETGGAYRCYCSRERIAAARAAHGRYDGLCRSSAAHRRGADSFVVRLAVPAGSVAVRDAVYGDTLVANELLDDAVLLKSDGFPTYHLASVVDDHLMGVTTVMRGQEWLPSTPLHLLIYRALQWEAPRFAHLPLLMNSDGTKLSKRQSDAFVAFYREKGYLPEALLNFVALLGWSPPAGRSEVMSLSEMVRAFDVAQINRADALVDQNKLRWFNRQHLILQSPPGGHAPRHLVPSLREALGDTVSCSDEYLVRVIRTMSVRAAGWGRGW